MTLSDIALHFFRVTEETPLPGGREEEEDDDEAGGKHERTSPIRTVRSKVNTSNALKVSRNRLMSLCKGVDDCHRRTTRVRQAAGVKKEVEYQKGKRINYLTASGMDATTVSTSPPAAAAAAGTTLSSEFNGSRQHSHPVSRVKRSQAPGTFVMTSSGGGGGGGNSGSINSRSTSTNLTAIAGKPFTLSCPFSSYAPVREVYFLRGQFCFRSGNCAFITRACGCDFKK